MGVSTWEARELRILESIRSFETRTVDNATAAVIESTELSEHDALAGIAALIHSGYVEGSVDVSSMADELTLPFLVNLRLLERGRRAVGQWPNEEKVVVALLEALTAAIDGADDEEERSRLKQLRESAGSVGRGTLAAVLATVGTSVAGL